MTILVTGANGFVGHFLCEALIELKVSTNGAIRYGKKAANLPSAVKPIIVPSLGPDTNWSEALSDIDVVIHLAGRVHLMKDRADDPLSAFRSVNVDATEHLARMAANRGIKRFIFISSIKVNGEGSSIPYNESDPPKPQDPYAISKWEAEQILRDISAKTGMETVIIRSPLVYGPEVRANFLRLLHLVDKGIPLPFAGIDNRRSLIYIGNLVDAIVTCVSHPNASNRTFIVSDHHDISTPDLIRHIATAMDKPARLFSLPPFLLAFMATVIGKKEFYNRLCGSLTVDAGAISNDLDWKPPFSLQEGLAHTVNWYLRNK
jgi:nucleoside-diphosphate-sugar epimerase